jgi:hypothetical protein
MALADAAGGFNNAIQQILMRRLAEQRYAEQRADHLKQQAFDNERAMHREKSGDEQTSYLRQRQDALDAEQQMTHDVAQGDKLNESIPGDTRLAPTDRAVGYLRTAGVPLQSVPGVPAMGPEFQGPMENGVTPQQAQTGIGAGFLKTASAAQQNTATDNERQAARDRETTTRDAEAVRHNQAMERNAANKPAATVTIQTVDANGNPVTRIVPKTAGTEFAKPANATTANRVASAETVNEVGADIVSKLSDPKFRATVGPAMGRYATLRDFIGDPPPEFSEFAGEIESYALANMGVHGMRSAQGAEQIKHLLDQRHTPESLAATIKGLRISRHASLNTTSQSRAVLRLDRRITIRWGFGKCPDSRPRSARNTPAPTTICLMPISSVRCWRSIRSMPTSPRQRQTVRVRRRRRRSFRRSAAAA